MIKHWYSIFFILFLLFILENSYSVESNIPLGNAQQNNAQQNNAQQNNAQHNNVQQSNIQHKVGSKTIAFFDTTRSRPLITYILYPAITLSEEKSALEGSWAMPPIAKDVAIYENLRNAPLIIFSHANGGSRLDSSWLMHALAKRGFIVASVDHYANTWYYNEPNEATKRWERTKDISFVVKQLIKYSEFNDKIDQNNIGFVGFSLGGLTGVWLAGGIANAIEESIKNEKDLLQQMDVNLAKQSYQDPLIKAAFLMAPANGFIFDSNSLKKISIPIYIIAGQNDKAVAINNAEYLAKWIPKAALKILPEKAGHFVFVNEISPAGFKFLPSYITKDEKYINKRALHKEISQNAIEFFEKHLK